jgi:hypothetical protein
MSKLAEMLSEPLLIKRSQQGSDLSLNKHIQLAKHYSQALYVYEQVDPLIFFFYPFKLERRLCLNRGSIQKFPDWVDNEINNNKHSLRSNTKGYGGKTHESDLQNSDTTAPSGRELYHLQFSLQPANPGTFGYTLVLQAFPGIVFKLGKTEQHGLHTFTKLSPSM